MLDVAAGDAEAPGEQDRAITDPESPVAGEFREFLLVLRAALIMVLEVVHRHEGIDSPTRRVIVRALRMVVAWIERRYGLRDSSRATVRR